MYMENIEELIRQLIREEIDVVLEGVAETTKALDDAKFKAAKEIEKMENETGFDKLKKQKDVIKAKRNVLKKTKDHIRSNESELNHDEKIISTKIHQAKIRGDVNSTKDTGMGF